MDSCPSETPIKGGRHFGESSRVGRNLLVIADLRGVLPGGIAGVSESGPTTRAPWRSKTSGSVQKHPVQEQACIEAAGGAAEYKPKRLGRPSMSRSLITSWTPW